MIDPFKGVSMLSLNPTTFPDAPNFKDDDLALIHHFMIDLALRNADKYLEQARSVKFPNTNQNVPLYQGDLNTTKKNTNTTGLQNQGQGADQGAEEDQRYAKSRKTGHD